MLPSQIRPGRREGGGRGQRKPKTKEEKSERKENRLSTTSRQRTVLPAPGDRLPLGDCGLKVSPFCLGMVGEPATVPAAFDAGVNFFFVTADMHWPLYEMTRRGLADLLARGGG